jgi:hypothetical protein
MCLEHDYHMAQAWDARSGHGSRYNFRSKYTLGATVRMKPFCPDGHESMTAYRLLVVE